MKVIEEVIWSVYNSSESIGFPDGGKYESLVVYKQEWDFDVPASAKEEISIFEGNPKDLCLFE